MRTDTGETVKTAGGTRWNLADGIEFDIRRQILRISHRIAGLLAAFQCELADRVIQLEQVVDATVRLRRRTLPDVFRADLKKLRYAQFLCGQGTWRGES